VEVLTSFTEVSGQERRETPLMLPLEKTQLELESCYEIADPVEDDFE